MDPTFLAHADEPFSGADTARTIPGPDSASPSPTRSSPPGAFYQLSRTALIIAVAVSQTVALMVLLLLYAVRTPTTGRRTDGGPGPAGPGTCYVGS